MLHFKIPRLDKDDILRKYLLKYCRLKEGEIWKDPKGKHKIACINATDKAAQKKMFGRQKAVLAVHDPPYNMVAFAKQRADKFTEWCREWIDLTGKYLKTDSSIYIWLGADQKKHFEPFPQFIMMMKDTEFVSKSFIERMSLYREKSLSVVKIGVSNLFATAHIRKSIWEPWTPRFLH